MPARNGPTEETGPASTLDMPELARQAEQAFNEGVERLRLQSREAAQAAGEQLEHARTYVVQRVQERPFTTTLAVLGAGFLIGLLFAGGRRR